MASVSQMKHEYANDKQMRGTYRSRRESLGNAAAGISDAPSCGDDANGALRSLQDDMRSGMSGGASCAPRVCDQAGGLWESWWDGDIENSRNLVSREISHCDSRIASLDSSISRLGDSIRSNSTSALDKILY